jgi:cytoskeletal protein CcmA (bactofilin family)
MGAQRAIFAANTAEPLKHIADHERSEPLCQLLTAGGDNRLDINLRVEPSEEAIRLRSQQIWEREGCPEGYAQEHWMRAKAELEAQMEKTSTTQLTAPVGRENDFVRPLLVQPSAMVPKASRLMANSTAPDAHQEVRHDDVGPPPRALAREDVTFPRKSKESVPAGPHSLPLVAAKRSKQPSAAPSIISADVVLHGTLESTGDIHLDGCVEGNVRSAGLVVGDEAVIQGEVVADDVTVRGSIRGRIRARTVLLCSGSRVEGDILYEILTVEAGAQLDASCQYLEDPLLQELVSEKTDFFTKQHALSVVTTKADAPAATRRSGVSENAGVADTLS